MKKDIQQEITNSIIEAIEAGTMPWRQPWSGGMGGMPTRSTGQTYSGINTLLLWLSANKNDFNSKYWFTFNQARKMDAMVRKGEKATKIVFYSTFEKPVEGAENPETIPFLKSYWVFNAEQIDNLPEKYLGEQQPTQAAPVEKLEQFFASVGAKISNGGGRAYYQPSTDQIQMPPIENFDIATNYYQTLSHEIIHWTGAKSRLDRIKLTPKKKEYAFEELVAEIGACFMGQKIGLQPDINQSASYISSWLKALKDDKKFIFQAASKAQKACDFVMDCAKEENTAPALTPAPKTEERAPTQMALAF